MRLPILLGILATSTALAACSSSSGSGGVADRGANVGADKVLAKTAGNAAQALADGTTLRASGRASSSWVRDFAADTGALAADSSVQIARNNAGGLDLITPNGTFHFTAADLSADGYGFELPDGSASLWAWNGNSMADALDPNGGRYSLVFDYHYDFEAGDTGANGFAVVGSETDEADLAALPTATYAGSARVRVAPEEGFTNYRDVVAEARGDVALTADFGAGEVSGDVTNLEYREPRNVDPTRSWTPFDGALTLETAAIEGNGFTGAVTADADFETNVGTIDEGSTYSGTFFGPHAEEVGGGINLTGTSAEDGAGYVGIGFWQGWMQ